jgi:hypothetical protein
MGFDMHWFNSSNRNDVGSSSSSMAGSTSMSCNPSSLSKELAQMQGIAKRLASHAADSTGDVTNAELVKCSDMDTLRKRCLEVTRHRDILRIQLDILQLQRELEGLEQTRTELSLKIFEALEGDFACSICEEVSE